MDAWIIADGDQLAGRIRESLLHLAIECPVTHVVRLESLGPQAEALAGFNGLVFFAVRQLERGYFEGLRQIRVALHDEAKLVVVSSVGDHGTVLNAMRAGAGDFLVADDNLHAEIASFVVRTGSQHKLSNVRGRVISIVPCHAPSDASLIAANLAAVIAKRIGSCGLLDYQLRGGELALLLKLSPRHTVVDLLRQQVTIEEAVFQQALTTHESGIRLLAGPIVFVDFKSVRPQVCQHIVDLARRSERFVIINSEDVQHAEQIRALAGSDVIVLTMRADVVSLHRAKQHIEFMTHNRVLREHVHVVALGAGHSGELSSAAMKKVLQVTSLHLIPDDPVSSLRSVNLGNPLVLECPHTRISRAITAVADSVAGGSRSAAQPVSRQRMAAVKAAAVAISVLPFGK